MTTSAETIPNKALSGSELRQILLEDFQRLLRNHGLLVDHLAYGRIAFRLTIRLSLDNESRIDETYQDSHAVGQNILESAPELTALESFPLADAPNAAAHETHLDRSITRPNAERLRMGMPVPAVTSNPDGSVTERQIQYPRTDGPGDVRIDDQDVETAT